MPFNGLLADLEEGWSKSVAFVVPPGTTWPLPLYELALMTAREVHGMGIDDARIELISPEPAPLALFGARASAAVGGLLDRAGVAFRGDTRVWAGDDGLPRLSPEGDRLAAERVVALPAIEGPHLAGVPADERGFIPIEERGAVAGIPDVYATGDATTYPVKQGAIACQLADAIAERLAARAGAAVEPQPFRPVLRGRLLTGRDVHVLEHELGDDAAPGRAVEVRLWSAAHKVEGRYLSPWLQELDGGVSDPAKAADDDVDIEVELPPTWKLAEEAMRLDPYSPPHYS